jgi:hypothetical protein
MRTSASLAGGQRIVKSFRYLLTDPREFDIVVFDTGSWATECSSIN